jgi:hypothetical protein
LGFFVPVLGAGVLLFGQRFVMSAHKIYIAPEMIAEGKRLHETTLTPLADIAAMIGITRGTLST